MDSPPVLPLADTILWSKLVDGVVLVAREGKTEKRQLQKGLELLDHSRLLGVVLNASSSTDHKNYYQRYTPAPSRVKCVTDGGVHGIMLASTSPVLL